MPAVTGFTCLLVLAEPCENGVLQQAFTVETMARRNSQTVLPRPLVTDSEVDATFRSLTSGVRVTVRLADDDDLVCGVVADRPGDHMVYVSRPSGAWRAVYRRNIRSITIER